jgi:hypothetical protein
MSTKPTSPLPVVVDSADDCCAADTPAKPLTLDRRMALTRRVRVLVAVTISYNVIEGIIAISAGTIAGSTALIGFGLDSMIEVSSAAIVAWQFSAPNPATRERFALRVIAYSFFCARAGASRTAALMAPS